MKILAIETSCDETAAAVVEDGIRIISNVVASSSVMHEKWGGIVPEVAAREQLKSLIPVLIESLKPFYNYKTGGTGRREPGSAERPGGIKDVFEQENIPTRSVISRKLSDGKVSTDGKNAGDRTRLLAYKPIIEQHIGAIAVTVGPGLIGSLLIGVEAAKTIAFVCHKPIIPVNHVLAHMYANFIRVQSSLRVDSGQAKVKVQNKIKIQNPQPAAHSSQSISFPAISLVVSGGHTELFLMTSPKKLKWLGGTIDDAAGEAFDKTARLLGFGSRGGAAIQEVANKFNISNLKFEIALPRPLLHDDSLNFSFSGLKTAILREVNRLKDHEKWNNGTIEQLAYETQEAITDVLVAKTLKAAEQFGSKSILISGGVASNLRLREKFNQQLTTRLAARAGNLQLFAPPVSLCTDNAVYIASCAHFRGTLTNWQILEAQPDLSVENI